MNVESLLVQYSEWRHEKRLELPSPRSTAALCVDMKENAGARGEGARYDTYEINGESFQARPDGGMGDLCDRMGRMIARDDRMLSVLRAVAAMPAHHKQVVEATYHVGPRDKPRGGREAASAMGLTHDAYRLAKASMLGWLERELN